MSKCPDCNSELEYSDVVFEDNIYYENNYYCLKCKEYKDEEIKILRKRK